MEVKITWNFAKTAGENNWTPGQHGKGMRLADGRELLWKVDEFDGFPTHPQIISKLRLAPWQVAGVTEMHANGSIRPADSSGHSDAWARQLAEQHGQRFVPAWDHPEADGWDFTSKTAVMTAPQQQRQWNTLSPSFDAEQVGKTTPNGWSVYRHNNAASVNAVGKQLQNCWQGSNDDFDFSSYHTLHGPDGLPQVAFEVTGVPGGIARQGYNKMMQETLGARNKKPSDEHYDELEQWARDQGIYHDEMARYRDQVSDWQDRVGKVGSAEYQTPEGYPEYQPGAHGRYIIDTDDVEHRWHAPSIGGPGLHKYHADLLRDNPHLQAREFGYITPEGEYARSGAGREQWRFGSTQAWQPGTRGKGAIFGSQDHPQLAAWSVDEDGNPHHYSVMPESGIYSFIALDINEDGGVSVLFGDPSAADIAVKLDPRLHVESYGPYKDGWKFEEDPSKFGHNRSASDTNVSNDDPIDWIGGEYDGWTPTNEPLVKGWITNNKVSHLWPCDERGRPHHRQMVNKGANSSQKGISGPTVLHEWPITMSYNPQTGKYDTGPKTRDIIAEHIGEDKVEPPTWSFSKVAGISRGKKLEILQQADQYHPDSSEIIHQFDDGWTMRKLQNHGDKAREGKLAHHCWSALSAAKDHPLDQPYYSEQYKDTIDNTQREHISLRDPDNWPHASFYREPVEGYDNKWQPLHQFNVQPHETTLLHSGYGHGDSQIAPKYQDRVRQWAQTVPTMNTTRAIAYKKDINDPEPATRTYNDTVPDGSEQQPAKPSTFSKVASNWITPEGFAEWRPGVSGRYIVDTNGQEHRWTAGGGPNHTYHEDWVYQHPELKHHLFGYISRQGEREPSYGSPDRQRDDEDGWVFTASEHQINYTPGQNHKGYIAGDGSIHVWPTDYEGWEGAPHHTEIMEQNGHNVGHDNYGENNPFIIDSEGNIQPVTTAGAEEIEFSIPAHVPGTRVQQGWHFGKTATIPSIDELAQHRYDSECYEVAQAVERQWPHLKADAGFYVNPSGQIGDHAWNRAPDGTIVDMTATQHGYSGPDDEPEVEPEHWPAPKHPEVIHPSHPHHQRYVSWEGDEERAQEIARQRGLGEGRNAKVGKQWLPDRDETAEYTCGQCAAWAAAHQQAHPHLQFGMEWERVPDEEAQRDADEDGEPLHEYYKWRAQHVFTHDDKYMYDVEGKHPLAEPTPWNKRTLNHSLEDVESTGLLEPGYMPSQEWIMDKAPHPYAAKVGETERETEREIVEGRVGETITPVEGETQTGSRQPRQPVHTPSDTPREVDTFSHSATRSPTLSHKDISPNPLQRPTTDPDSGAYRTEASNTLTSFLSTFPSTLSLSSIPRGVEAGDGDRGAENGRERSAGVHVADQPGLAHSTGRVKGQAGCDYGAGAQAIGVAGPSEGAYLAQHTASVKRASQGQIPEDRPSSKRMVRGLDIRESIQMSDAGHRTLYHNGGQESRLSGEDRQVPWKVIASPRTETGLLVSEHYDHHPLWFDHDEKAVHLGLPGTHHADLLADNPALEEKMMAGDHMDSKQHRGMVYPMNGKMVYEGPPEAKPAVEAHLGKPLDLWKGWHFGSESHLELPEGYREPDMNDPEDTYKGLELKDGRSVYWALYGHQRTDQTAHAYLMEKMGIKPEQVARYLDSTGREPELRSPEDQQFYLDNVKRIIERKNAPKPPPMTSWNFSNVQESRLSAKIVQVPTPSDISHKGYTPAIHDVHADTLYVGSPGSSHASLIKFTPELDYNPYAGSQGIDSSSYRHGQMVDGKFQAFDPWGEKEQHWDFTASEPQGTPAEAPVPSVKIWDFPGEHNHMGEDHDRPWAYSPRQNIVHVGPPNSYHTDLRNHIVENGGPDIYIGDHMHGRTEYITNRGQRKEPVIEALNQAKIPIGYKNGWHFAATEFPAAITPENEISRIALPAQPWQKGMNGKGLIHNGQPYLWKSEPRSGDPHHHDVMQHLDKGLEEPKGSAGGAFYVRPDGEVIKAAPWGYESDSFATSHPDLYAKPQTDWNFSKVAVYDDDPYEYDPYDDPTDFPEGGLYHMAPTRDRKRILQHGLQMSAPAHNPRWQTQDLEAQPTEPPGWLKKQPHGVYGVKYEEDSDNWMGDAHVAPEGWDRWFIPEDQIHDIVPDHVGNAWVIPHSIPNPILHEPVENHPTEDHNWKGWPENWQQHPIKVVGSNSPWHNEAHYNRWTGKVCNCPWGGKKHRQSKTAGQELNRVLKAPDKAYQTPEGEAFRKDLPGILGEEHDALAPYIAQRWKKGDIMHAPYPSDAEGQERPGYLTYAGQYGPQRVPLNTWNQWIQAKQHPTRQGVNFMAPDFTPQHFQEAVDNHQQQLRHKELLKNGLDQGDVVHQFPNGWHIRHITAPGSDIEQAMSAEGQAMGHCIGQDEQPYKNAAHSEATQVYSLRDKQGFPHGTWHTDPEGNVAEIHGNDNKRLSPPQQEMYEQWAEKQGVDPRPNGYDFSEYGDEEQYDDEITVPGARDVDEYLDHFHPDSDRYYYEDAERHGNQGPETEINVDDPDWDSIVYDLTNKDRDERENVYNTAHHNSWDYHDPTNPIPIRGQYNDLKYHLEDAAANEPEEYQHLLDEFNQNHAQHFDRDGKFKAPESVYEPMKGYRWRTQKEINDFREQRENDPNRELTIPLWQNNQRREENSEWTGEKYDPEIGHRPYWYAKTAEDRSDWAWDFEDNYNGWQKAPQVWEPGFDGKGVFLENGRPVVWKTDNEGFPRHDSEGLPNWHHSEGKGYNSTFHVDPKGHAGFHFPEHVEQRHIEALKPLGINLDPSQAAGWRFAAWTPTENDETFQWPAEYRNQPNAPIHFTDDGGMTGYRQCGLCLGHGCAACDHTGQEVQKNLPANEFGSDGATSPHLHELMQPEFAPWHELGPKQGSSLVNGGQMWHPWDGKDTYYDAEPAPAWELGASGKGTFVGGVPHLWAVNKNEEPHHDEAVDGLGHQADGYFYIDPDGAVEGWGEDGRKRADDFAKVHPDLHAPVQEGWSFAKIASKMEWLESRPDKFKDTPEGLDCLKALKRAVDRTPKLDPLTPWLWREMKKGRIEWDDVLTRNQMSHLADWYTSKSPTRKGVDVMQKTWDDVQGLLNQWDEELASQESEANLNNGKVVHQYPNGWTMRELGPQDLQYEGDQMGHCVGGSNYERAVEVGDTTIYSLRDEKNIPHATIELENDVTDYRDGKPIAWGAPGLEQIQGKGNTILKPEYQAMVKEFFGTLPKKPEWQSEAEPIDHIEEIAEPELNAEHGWGGYGPHGDYGLEDPPRATDYESVIDTMLNKPRPAWADDYYDHSHGKELYDHALKRNEIPELAHHVQQYAEETAHPQLMDLHDHNWEYLNYPGEDFEEAHERNPDVIQTQEDFDNAYREYEWAQEDLEKNHAPSQLVSDMYDHLNKHYNQETGKYENPGQPGKLGPTVFSRVAFEQSDDDLHNEFLERSKNQPTDQDILNLLTPQPKRGVAQKGLELPDWSRYFWTPDEMGFPHHDEVAQILKATKDTIPLEVSPDGKITEAHDYSDMDWSL